MTPTSVLRRRAYHDYQLAIRWRRYHPSPESDFAVELALVVLDLLASE